MSTLSTTLRAEGHEAARLVLARMALCHDTTEQAELLHEAMLDLIDVSLGWNNLEPTRERLAGFAQVIAPLVSAASLSRTYRQSAPALHHFAEVV
ncbi:hypothetical protein [Neopusillimonas aromaticivorans]|uniref:hypothetical protein n=1 Tax=Neopusillimonas aromaticivorans TaxID=2979868 RepID=UPI002599992B|nr:hypothetical protein [Neopusillimonas aromaticivorans]WJJ94731.1 hypothetical protein N7E01_07470 [Neopusillimonas aromaticivorans]